MKSDATLLILVVCAPLLVSCKAVPNSRSALLLHPAARELNRRAPDSFKVRLETSRGVIVIAVHRDWSPRGADRFYNLVAAGYYDGSRFFRVIEGKWAQFGINGDPKIASAWRERSIPDDPRVA